MSHWLNSMYYSSLMKVLYVVVLIVICFGFRIDEVSGRDDVRLSALETMVQKRGPVLAFDQDQYQKFVIEGDRHYDLVLLYSAGSDVDCKQCREAKKYFDAVAQAYHEAGSMVLDKTKTTKQVFFVFVNLRRHPSISYMHGLTRVPVWVYLGGQRTLARMPPRTDTKNPHIPIPLPEDSIMDRVFRGVTPKVSALKWVNLQSGMSHVAFRRTASEIVYSAALIFCLLGIGSIVPIKLIYIARSNPVTMSIGALCIQILACGAICWCVLHGAQWIGTRGPGSYVIIHPSRRNQYVVEGLLMSSMTVAGGLLFYVAGLLIRSRRKFGRPYCALSLSVMILAYGCYFYILKVHNAKSGIPESSFFPPPEYVRGPLRVDRGNSL